MTDEQAAQLIDQNRMLLDKVASFEAGIQQQKGLVAALLKRLYGSKSEQLSHDQLLMTFLEDEAKKPDAAESQEEGPAASPDESAAEPKPKAPRAKRTSKLADSLKSLPTTERTIVSPEVLKNPEDYRLIGEEVSERLHISPAAFTREVVRRQTHVRRRDPCPPP